MTTTARTELFRLPPEEKIGPVYDALTKYYGELVWRPRTDPLSELVGTILSQNTSDVNSGRAFESLRQRFPTWDEVMDAPVEELAEAIKPGGLANVKAPRVQSVLRAIYEERGSLDLDFLYDSPLEDAKAWLSGFKGVGPKTAACVLMFACGRPVLPVDTHVYRVSRRIGLIDPTTNVEKAHTVLERMLEPQKRYTFHVDMITHGRQICKAPRPLCELCVVREWCNYYAGIGDRAGAAGKQPGDS